jgi:hypothetical protein
LTSPLHTLDSQIPGFDKPVLFTDLWDVTSPVCLAYHQSLHKDGHGTRDWDLEIKPLAGWPLYVGWLDAVQKAIDRLEKGTYPPSQLQLAPHDSWQLALT